MMDWLVGGGHFRGRMRGLKAMSSLVLEAGGHHALFIWTLGGESSYSPTLIC